MLRPLPGVVEGEAAPRVWYQMFEAGPGMRKRQLALRSTNTLAKRTGRELERTRAPKHPARGALNSQYEGELRPPQRPPESALDGKPQPKPPEKER